MVGGGDRPAAGADWTTPVLGIGGLIATALLCWVGVVTVERAIERRRVLRVYQSLLRTGQHGFQLHLTVLHVRVPPGREPESGEVLAAINRRWLTGRPRRS